MKKFIFLLMFVFASLTLTSSCITPSEIEVAYEYEYMLGESIYPVYYIDGYPYYWFNSRWILIPYDRYFYIRHRYNPGYLYMPRYYDSYRYHSRPPRRPHHDYGRPHTPQPRHDGNRFGGGNNRNPGSRPNVGHPNGGRPGGGQPSMGNRPSARPQSPAPSRPSGGQPGGGRQGFGGRR